MTLTVRQRSSTHAEWVLFVVEYDVSMYKNISVIVLKKEKQFHLTIKCLGNIVTDDSRSGEQHEVADPGIRYSLAV